MKSCTNCKYSFDAGPLLVCFGQRNAPEVKSDYGCERWKSKYATNADRIRSMTVEELAEFLVSTSEERCAPGCYDCRRYDNCKEAWLDWLKKEVEK